jgi:diguanylate cyclase (GGDEF)-like protein
VTKLQAEQTINTAFTAILEKLQAQEEYNHKLIIDDLHRLAQALNSDSSSSLNLHAIGQDFSLDYKELAKESLNSYEQTTESVAKINQEQKELIKQSSSMLANESDKVLDSFNNVFDQVEAQMRKANETIEDLRTKISILEKSSNLDPLTRTYNRRALDTYLESLCKIQHKKLNTRIMLIDIDDFKKVNDTYGHLAGDRVLMFLAKLISSCLREGDKVFRFGGEEFLVILSRADEKTGIKVAERILKGVRDNTLFYKNHEIKITLSLGITNFQVGDSCDSFIDRADKALYTAKKSGKDQVVVG